MKFYSFIIFLSLSIFVNAKNTDDSIRRKLSIELGFHTSYFLSKKINNNFQNQWMFYPIVSGLGFGYQIDKRNKISFLTYRYSNFKLGKNVSIKVLGDVNRIEYYLVSLGLQKSFFANKKLSFNSISNLNWRYGEENFFLYNFHSEYHGSVYYYNSFGLGIGSSINCKLTKRTYLNVDLTLNHFFEKFKISSSTNPNYKPIKNMIFGNFKFGILL
jgi:hypothetical protein